MSRDKILIEVKNLKKHFPVRKGVFKRMVAHVKAVDGIDLFIREGETFGLNIDLSKWMGHNCLR